MLKIKGMEGKMDNSYEFFLFNHPSDLAKYLHLFRVPNIMEYTVIY